MKKRRRLALFLAAALFLSSASFATQEPVEETPITSEDELFTVGELVPVGEPFEVTPEMVLERQNARAVPRPEWPEEKTYDHGEDFQFSIGEVERIRLEGGVDDLDSGARVTDSGPPDRAALADLRVIRLATTMAKPLPVGIEVPFTVQVENIGTATAYNPTVAIYFDNKLEGTVTVVNSLAPNEGVIFAIDGRTSTVGNHTLKVVVNPSSTIPESSYGNNTVSVTYAWATWPNLSAYEILYTGPFGDPSSSVAGDHWFESMQLANFRFAIVNLGPATGTNILVEVYMKLEGNARQRIANTTLPSLASGAGQYLGLEGFFRNSGELEIELRVDPNNTCRDYFRGNNDMLEFFMVEPHFDRNLVCRWDDPSQLKSLCYPSATAQLERISPPITTMMLTDTIQDWNGTAGVVEFSDVIRSQDSPSMDSAYDVIFTSYTDNTKNYYADTAFFAKNAQGVLYPINPYEHDDPIGRCVIRLYPLFDTLDLELRKWVLRHEAGHVLGLDHPFDATKPQENPYACEDAAVMRNIWEDSHSNYITWHDEAQVERIYY